MERDVLGLRASRVLYGLLEGEVRAAMALQPIRDLVSGTVLGHEALFRVTDYPDLTPPSLWAEAARTGLVDSLEDRVAELCARLERPPGWLFVNSDPESTGVATRWSRLVDIVVELSETGSIPERTLVDLRNARVPYALDDVGTGQANFGALVRMRPAFIKIDRSLVAGCDSDDGKAAMLGLLARYASQVGASAIAEGVEREAEASCLPRLGIRYGPGFWIGRPKTEGCA